MLEVACFVVYLLIVQQLLLVNNGNCTEWGAIWAEIIRVISKLNERAAQVRFEITSMISDQIEQPEVQLPLRYLDPFLNRTI